MSVNFSDEYFRLNLGLTTVAVFCSCKYKLVLSMFLLFLVLERYVLEASNFASHSHHSTSLIGAPFKLMK